MKTSKLRKMRDFCANVDIDTPATKLAAEVIRLREALAQAIELAEDVAAMPLAPRATADLRALLTEHDEPSNIAPQVSGSCDVS